MKNWLLLLILILQIPCWAQQDDDDDVDDLSNFINIPANFPTVEFPISVLPFSQYEVLVPINKSNTMQPLFLLKGNYTVYPRSNGLWGLYFGFRFGDFPRQKFNERYTVDGSIKPLEVLLFSRIIDAQFGIKVIDYQRKSRYRPYTECAFSIMTLTSRMSVAQDDRKARRNQEETLESRRLRRNRSNALHVNVGVEIDLMKSATISNRKNKDDVFFFHVGIGYTHSMSQLGYYDFKAATFEEAALQSQNQPYATIASEASDFVVFVPDSPLAFRHLNLSFGFTYRI